MRKLCSALAAWMSATTALQSLQVFKCKCRAVQAVGHNDLTLQKSVQQRQASRQILKPIESLSNVLLQHLHLLASIIKSNFLSVIHAAAITAHFQLEAQC